MSWQERVGLLVIVVVIVVEGLVMVAVAGPSDAKAIPNCTIPPKPPGSNFLNEAQVFDDVSQDVVSEAEHFVCHEIRHPAELRGWKLQGIDAFRMQFLDASSWRVHLRYTLGIYGTSTARYLVLIVQKADTRGPLASEVGVEKIWLGGRPAELVRRNTDSDDVLIRWQQDGLHFEADLLPATGAQDVQLSELVTFLRSVD